MMMLLSRFSRITKLAFLTILLLFVAASASASAAAADSHNAGDRDEAVPAGATITTAAAFAAGIDLEEIHDPGGGAQYHRLEKRNEIQPEYCYGTGEYSCYA